MIIDGEFQIHGYKIDTRSGYFSSSRGQLYRTHDVFFYPSAIEAALYLPELPRNLPPFWVADYLIGDARTGFIKRVELFGAPAEHGRPTGFRCLVQAYGRNADFDGGEVVVLSDPKSIIKEIAPSKIIRDVPANYNGEETLAAINTALVASVRPKRSLETFFRAGKSETTVRFKSGHEITVHRPCGKFREEIFPPFPAMSCAC